MQERNQIQNLQPQSPEEATQNLAREMNALPPEDGSNIDGSVPAGGTTAGGDADDGAGERRGHDSEVEQRTNRPWRRTWCTPTRQAGRW